MKNLIKFGPGRLFETRFGVCLLSGVAVGVMLGAVVLQARGQQMPQPKTGEIHDAQTKSNSIDGLLPDQAHAMVDVGYHFANLWFAAGEQNWPLADYYLRVTRSHLKWAVRIHPVRKISSGAEVDLNGILQAVDNGYLTALAKAIENKDAAGFETAYRQTLDGCYACHTACEKPYLRPQVPSAASVTILNFNPDVASQK